MRTLYELGCNDEDEFMVRWAARREDPRNIERIEGIVFTDALTDDEGELNHLRYEYQGAVISVDLHDTVMVCTLEYDGDSRRAAGIFEELTVFHPYLMPILRREA